MIIETEIAEEENIMIEIEDFISKNIEVIEIEIEIGKEKNIGIKKEIHQEMIIDIIIKIYNSSILAYRFLKIS